MSGQRRNLQYAVSLNNLAGIHKAHGRYAQAEALYRRSLAITEEALGPDHPLTRRAIVGIATCRVDFGHPHAALPVLEKGIEWSGSHTGAQAEARYHLGRALWAAFNPATA